MAVPWYCSLPGDGGHRLGALGAHPSCSLASPSLDSSTANLDVLHHPRSGGGLQQGHRAAPQSHRPSAAATAASARSAASTS